MQCRCDLGRAPALSVMLTRKGSSVARYLFELRLFRLLFLRCFRRLSLELLSCELRIGSISIGCQRKVTVFADLEIEQGLLETGRHDWLDAHRALVGQRYEARSDLTILRNVSHVARAVKSNMHRRWQVAMPKVGPWPGSSQGLFGSPNACKPPRGTRSRSVVTAGVNQ